MSSAPGMAPPPGVAQQQANRPSVPMAFQLPPSFPNINVNAPVIRLGNIAPQARPSLGGDRRDGHTSAGGNRHGMGERGFEQSRNQMRESMQSLIPPTSEERLRTIFIHKIPAGVGGEQGIQRLLGTVGRVRKWDSALSHCEASKGELYGFVQYDDAESLACALEALKDIEVPVAKQTPVENPPQDDDGSFADMAKVKLQVVADENTVMYLDDWKRNQGDDNNLEAKVAEAKAALKQHVRTLFYPPTRNGQDADGDAVMSDGANGLGENVEVINIPLAQEDELADIPAEMRETVASEIAAFRDRSNRRDMERLRREEEFEEQERQRNGAPRTSGYDLPTTASANSNMVPLGPRGVHNAPSGPRGQVKGIDFVNGGTTNGFGTTKWEDSDDTDTSDEELYRRELDKKKAEEEKLYLEAERKWTNRERQRTAALERETERERAEIDGFARRRDEQLEREKNWDDERESARKTHPYYRDRAYWARTRAQFRADEAAADDMDRRAGEDERRRAEAEMEQARGLADSFLERQAEEMERRPEAPVAAPQRLTISFGAAAQKAQQRSAPVRRTVAEVEGLLDDEEHEHTTKRQLVPIKFEPITNTKAMSEEDIHNAVKALAQEVPADRDELWQWDVKWDYLEDSIIREKLRPFIEKKVVEYLGIQEQFLVDVVEEHLRKHLKPSELVLTLGEALDEDAEDLVKKLWRMLILYTECEKRGLPA
ncbi:hypothetical protein B0T26DRAFT_700807 [Lasiosphaeria miniovina]|uniref:PWI domain-containing protein n=1 Tax=Lasiosphaeria miniovina TaxID=1954250 RepID=A0AA40ATZ1_9PEZI|nr:uncharacterized protein B0T26DRAFT_700807 [Lasiosphaeria miniovina]KAK0721963.1 hypothetical protein B0T26DRAFT_700807 [Lasiosphaeria miniovina]